MDDRAFHFAMADRRYFDDPWEHPDLVAEEVFGPAGTELPAPWRRRRHGPWIGFDSGLDLPGAGWKLHISATPDRAGAVAKIVDEVCRPLRVSWKTLANRGLVLINQSKYAPRVSSGKVITVYPHDEAILERLLEQLRSRLAGVPGPRAVGEICLPDAPIALRWGAFRPAWVRGSDGLPTPGMQLPDGQVAVDHRMTDQGPEQRPACVRAAMAAAREWDEQHVLPLRACTLVQRTNTGAIYSAREESGRPVILKEARHHSGLAKDGSDAVDRLRHERRVLQRLGGLGVAPEPLDYLRCGDSDFLVMEPIAGDPLHTWVVRNHPCTRLEATPADLDGYYRRVEEIHAELERTLALLHRHGVVHRDLHPSNVVLSPAGLRLIDFECAWLDGAGVTELGGAPGFSFDVDGEPRDLAGCDRIRLMMLNPVVAVLDSRPDLISSLELAASEDREFALTGQVPTELAPAPRADSLARGILRGATLRRTDRLYPGSVEQLHHPSGGLGLLTGAAGVQLALLACGRRVPSAQVRWLRDQPLERTAGVRGLGSGADGIALALARLGEHERAGDIVDRMLGQALPPSTASWAHGHAGCALATAELAGLLDRPDLIEVAADHLRACLDLVGGPEGPAQPGLLHGWAGVALSLIRLLEESWTGHQRDGVCEAISWCFEQDLAYCREDSGHLLGISDRKALPYLGVGSAALGLVADWLMRAELHPRAGIVRAQVLRTLRRPMVVAAGLFHGRAGLALVLSRLAPDEPALALHRSRLSWHLVGPTDAQETLGEQNLRRSLDLLSGSAGLLLACAPRSAATILPLPARQTDLSCVAPVR